MSRTFRRKNIEKTQNRSWDKRGNTVAGYYTKCDVTWETREDGRWVRINTFREPTKHERFKMVQRAHGESSHNKERSPGPWHRENRMAQNRMINKTEIHRWIKEPDGHEPLFEADPRSCWWDWD